MCGPPLAEAALAALAALVDHPISLTFAAFTRPSACTLSMLSSFTAMATCHFAHAQEGQLDPPEDVGALDLTALQSLPHLSKLSIDCGYYEGIGSLPHLTYLRLCTAKVTYEYDDTQCLYLNKLQKLDMMCSILVGFPSTGLPASLALLRSEESIIFAGETLKVLDTSRNNAFVALNMPAVTSLVELVLAHNNASESISDLEWLYGCCSLEVLELHCFNDSRRVKVSNKLTLLNRLRVLKVSMSHVNSMLTLLVPWRQMQTLQSIDLSVAILVF